MKLAVLVNGGDDFLRVMLFWSMFLPLGKVNTSKFDFSECILIYFTTQRFSIDRALKLKKNFITENSPLEERSTAHQTVVGCSTVAVYVQFMILYYMSWALKTGEEWSNGTAVYYALNLDFYATRFAQVSNSFLQFLTLCLDIERISVADDVNDSDDSDHRRIVTFHDGSSSLQCTSKVGNHSNDFWSSLWILDMFGIGILSDNTSCVFTDSSSSIVLEQTL